MPFTIAHPAAVLPLKRFCPRYLSFSALVIGSAAPDAGYAFGSLRLETLHCEISDLSHTFAGSFLFCLPVGALMLAALHWLRGPVIERLPERKREVFRPLCRQPIAAPFVLVVSLLLGSWTHLAWDSFTHSHSWLVLRVPLLQTPLAAIGQGHLQICHLLWYASSFGGVAVLCFAYEKWLRASRAAWSAQARAAALRHALLVGLLILPIEAIHHLIGNVVGYGLAGACSILLVIIVALTIDEPKQKSKIEDEK